MPDITTVIADLDGSSVKACYAYAPVETVIETLSSGKPVKCECDGQTIYVMPGSVKYMQSGKWRIRVSSAPSAMSVSEHASLVSGTHQ